MGTDHLVNLGTEGRIILKLIVQEYIMRMWTGLNWLRIYSSDVLSSPVP